LQSERWVDIVDFRRALFADRGLQGLNVLDK